MLVRGMAGLQVSLKKKKKKKKKKPHKQAKISLKCPIKYALVWLKLQSAISNKCFHQDPSNIA